MLDMNNEQRATILLVDDTLANISVLGEGLSPLYDIRVATSGQEALDAIAADPSASLSSCRYR